MCCAQLSGSTATVLAVSGWQAVIASVGDSCAYLDTGAEVVLVSAPYLVYCRCWREESTLPNMQL